MLEGVARATSISSKSVSVPTPNQGSSFDSVVVSAVETIYLSLFDMYVSHKHLFT